MIGSLALFVSGASTETLTLERAHPRSSASRCWRTDTVLGTKVLVPCRPRPGVDRDQTAPNAAGEMAALRSLKAEGPPARGLPAGWAGRGADPRWRALVVEAAVASLPLRHAGLIDAELTELHPFAGF